eukprot:TRINITY_DN14565_c0_g1_i2.p2 TRINITY_DN14565_c0_g1~~TRINITY_DN14565_c0_g1_i2.p2  ORF type:complete len:235 (+),score=55.55 TRINITY_DN14565_c0_g1_i2:63-767(+)
MYTPPPPPPPLVPSAPARPEWLELCGNLTETDLAPPFGSFAAAQCGSAWKRYESWRKARKAQPAAAPDPVEAVSCLAEDVEGGPSRGTKLTPDHGWEVAGTSLLGGTGEAAETAAAQTRKSAEESCRRLNQRRMLAAWLEGCAVRIPFDRGMLGEGCARLVTEPGLGSLNAGYRLPYQCSKKNAMELCDAALRSEGFAVVWDRDRKGAVLTWDDAWYHGEAARRVVRMCSQRCC